MHDYCYKCPYSVVSSSAFGELSAYNMRCSAADQDVVSIVFDKGYLTRFQPADWCPLKYKQPRDLVISIVY